MLEQIIEQIKVITERNKKVELDKAWETSLTRRISIAILTYIVAVAWLWLIAEQSLFLKALVPVFGYLLSTLSLPFIKSLWQKTKK